MAQSVTWNGSIYLAFRLAAVYTCAVCVSICTCVQHTLITRTLERAVRTRLKQFGNVTIPRTTLSVNTYLNTLCRKRIDGVSTKHSDQLPRVRIEVILNAVQIALRVGLEFSKVTLDGYYFAP